MITVKESRKGIRFAYVYFANEKCHDIDVGYYIEALRNIDINMKNQSTLITDLSLDEDNIFNQFKSNVRNEIRSIEKLGGVLRY